MKNQSRLDGIIDLESNYNRMKWFKFISLNPHLLTMNFHGVIIEKTSKGYRTKNTNPTLHIPVELYTNETCAKAGVGWKLLQAIDSEIERLEAEKKAIKRDLGWH